MILCVIIVWFQVLFSIVSSLRSSSPPLPSALTGLGAGELSAHVSWNTKPIIVMSTGGGLWNTGVWSGYGSEVSKLAWANQGVVVDKTNCPHKCVITHEQSHIPKADAVVMEVINHKKFLGGKSTSVPFPYPPRRSDNSRLPIQVAFYFEPGELYPEVEDTELMDHFDIVMSPVQSSHIPLTMVCPWGYPASDYLHVPDFSKKQRFIAYFNEHGIHRSYSRYISGLVQALGTDIDAFGTLKNTVVPDEAKSPHTRIQLLSKYKYVLVTEHVVEDDWVEAELSQAILAGTIPLYIGAPNIEDFMPSPHSFIHLRDWETRSHESLINFLRSIADDPVAYSQFFDWKRGKKLPEKFQEKLDRCVFYAECRLCEEVKRRLGQL
eukprot:c9331_g1_i1.p1 GENE.c9331_g1_i1~~c9331_g1_i1.p1  ORF type:complete len:413 (+),score=80.65 c9331_g1_i1:103-1239(+)